MKEESFEDWDEFVRFVRRATIQIYPIYWRGQSDHRWVLASAFERDVLKKFGGGQITPFETHPYGNKLNRVNGHVWCEGMTTAMRDGILRDFKRLASGCRGRNPPELDDDQWWAIGRHFGLVTPLLDWSESPYIAAFFALSEVAIELSSTGGPINLRRAFDKKVAVYSLFFGPELHNDECLRIINPQVDEIGRVHGQQSVFTRLTSEEYFDVQGYLDSTGRGDHLTKITLSDGVLGKALKDFALHGISFRSIFPDIEGAAREVNYRKGAFRNFTFMEA